MKQTLKIAVFVTVLSGGSALWAQTDGTASSKIRPTIPGGKAANPAGNSDGRPAAPVNPLEATARLEQQVAALSKRIQKLETELATVRKRQTADFESLSKALMQTNSNYMELANLVERTSQRVKDVASNVDSNSNTLQRVIQQDGENGLLGNMQNNQKFRDEFMRATQGKLWIHNYTGAEQIIYVNGTAWRARVNKSYIYVPVATVAIATRPEDTPMFAGSTTSSRQWEFNATQKRFELVYELKK